MNKYNKDIEYITQIRYLQVLIYKIGRGQKTKPNQDIKIKSHDALSPYSYSGDHQFIPLKFRRLMNTSPKIDMGLWRGAANRLNPWRQGLVSLPPTSDKSEPIETNIK